MPRHAAGVVPATQASRVRETRRGEPRWVYDTRWTVASPCELTVLGPTLIRHHSDTTSGGEP